MGHFKTPRNCRQVTDETDNGITITKYTRQVVKAHNKLAELKRGSGITQSFRASAFQTRLSRTETLVVCSLYIH